MQKNTYTLLTQSYMDWQHGIISYDAFFEKVLSYCYSYGLSKLQLDEDQNSEFLLHMIPRWESLLKSFSYRGISIDSYIARVLYLNAPSFFKQKRFHRQREEHAYQLFLIEEMPHIEEREANLLAPSLYLLNELISHPYMAKHPSYCRILCILFYDELIAHGDERFMSKLSCACSCDSSQIQAWLIQTQKIMQRAREKAHNLETQLSTLLAQLHALQKEASLLKAQKPINKEAIQLIEEKISRKENLRAQRIEALKKAQGRPSGRKIAQILGVPASTITTAMRIMKVRLHPSMLTFGQ